VEEPADVEPSAPGASTAREGDEGRAARVQLPHSTYSPIRVLMALLTGEVPDGRGQVFREPWMNTAAVMVASILLGLLLGVLGMAAFGALPQTEAEQPELSDLPAFEDLPFVELVRAAES
jgi:hypothetical protein